MYRFLCHSSTDVQSFSIMDFRYTKVKWLENDPLAANIILHCQLYSLNTLNISPLSIFLPRPFFIAPHNYPASLALAVRTRLPTSPRCLLLNSCLLFSFLPTHLPCFPAPLTRVHMLLHLLS